MDIGNKNRGVGTMRRGIRVWAAALAATTMVVAPLPMGHGGSGVSAQEVAGVEAYVEVGSVAPGVGCAVNTSIEVRQDGTSVAGVDVGLSLVIDGEIASMDRSLTDDNGVAWLKFQTDGAYDGASAWLDVLLDGTYAGSTEIHPTTDGSCDGNSSLLQLEGAVALGDTLGVVDDSETASSAASGTFIGVPTYTQQRNLSCEYASLVIAMGAFGADVSEWDLDGIVGWSANPHWGFRGDITGWWGNTDDYGVYAEALVPGLNAYGFSGDVFYGQGDSGALTSRLDNGEPTLVWLGYWGDTSFYDSTDDGSAFKLAAGEHVVVAYGYDADGVYASDPASGTTRFYGWHYFLSMWNVLDGMALAVSPA